MIFKCLICENFSFDVICENCQQKYLKPKIRKKEDVVSFYDYETIEYLIKYKYHKFGHRVFKILAKNSISIFAKEIKENFYIIPVDDKIKKGYSHTAILAQKMKTKYLKHVFGVLQSTNDIQYAGKSLEFRLNHPRNFKYNGQRGIDVILVDDISTTGLTLKEAKACLEKSDVNVVLSVVLANLKK